VNGDADTVFPGSERCLAVHLEQRAERLTSEPALETVLRRARRLALRRRLAGGAAVVVAVTLLAGAFRRSRRRRRA
jgi:hypothetical protein